MTAMWKARGIRGATTVEENSAAAINSATLELLKELISQNDVDKDEIVSILFTMTKDLNAAFPATVARIEFGWDTVPLFCVEEMNVPGDLSMCIRFLVTINTTKTNNEIKHIYMRGAKVLRPDISGKQ